MQDVSHSPEPCNAGAQVYELDTFMRFMNHPNVISLYTMWNEPIAGPYAYKTLVSLYREGVRGDLYDYAIDRPDGRRLRTNRIKLLSCNIATALRSFHNCNLIHAGIRPRNIYGAQYSVFYPRS